MPARLNGLAAAFLAQILAQHPMIGAQQVLEKILMPFAR